MTSIATNIYSEPDWPNISEYATLDASRKEIRLLHIHPGRGTDHIACHFSTASLALVPPWKPTYIALSYAWGSPGDMGCIKVHGEDVYLRKTVFEMLHALREQDLLQDGEGGYLPVWLDILCINQRDNIEKSLQVTMMLDIFRGAAHIFAWLGSSEESVDAAARLWGDEIRWDLRYNDGQLDRTLLGECLRKHEPVIERLFIAVASRKYWSRLWIAQEIFHDRPRSEVTFLIGNHALPWNCLQFWIQESDHEWKHTSRFFNENLPPEKFRTLPATMLHFDQWDCRDPRDKVFGLLGMCNEDTRNKINVDYGKTKIELFQSLLESGVYEKTSVDRLCAAVVNMRISATEIETSRLPDTAVRKVKIPLYLAGMIVDFEKVDIDIAAPGRMLRIKLQYEATDELSAQGVSCLFNEDLQHGDVCMKMPYYDGEIYLIFRQSDISVSDESRYLGQFFVPHEDTDCRTQLPPSILAGLHQKKWTFELDRASKWTWLIPSRQTFCDLLEVVSLAHAGRVEDMGVFPDAGSARMEGAPLFPFLRN